MKFQAVFDVRVACTEGWSVLGNTPVARSEEEVTGRPGYTWTEFQPTPRMSPYLFAIAIQDYIATPGPGNVTVWTTPSHVGYAGYAAQVGPAVIETVEQLYGVAYSLPKMDMVSVPNQASAMENWGLILYAYEWLLYDPAQPDPQLDSRFDVLETVAHELAHQWFGNLVTMVSSANLQPLGVLP